MKEHSPPALLGPSQHHMTRGGGKEVRWALTCLCSGRGVWADLHSCTFESKVLWPTLQKTRELFQKLHPMESNRPSEECPHPCALASA